MISGSELLQMVNSLGLDISKSGMFGCENESQGRVFAFHCITTGQDILTIPQEYHLMNKKLSLRADAMLARLSKNGGRYEVIEHSTEAAEIVLEYKGRRIKERLSWEEAKQEPFVYAGKESDVLAKLAAGKASELTIKSNYATPRKRMQMLWSRVISDGVRVVAPELVTGSYTPVEIADFSGIDLGKLEASKTVIATQTQTQTQPDTRTVANDKALVDPPATEDQVLQIETLFNLMNVSPANREASFAARGAKDARGLTAQQATAMITAMRDRLDQHAAEKPDIAKSAEAINVNGPCTKQQYEAIVAKIKEVAQGPKSELTKRIQQKLLSAGMKIGNLTYDQARLLQNTLDGIEAEAFFECELVKQDTADQSAA